MNTATEDQRQRVFDRIEDVFFDEEFVNETAINDLVWFDCDDIFFPDSAFGISRIDTGNN